MNGRVRSQRMRSPESPARPSSSAAQRVAFADDSQRTSHQQTLIDSIQNGPVASAQAAQLKSLFGPAEIGRAHV